MTTIRECTLAACETFGVTPLDIRSRRRDAHTAKARQTAYWLARNATQASLTEIGMFLRRADHSAVVHGIQRVEWFRSRDVNYKAMTDKLLARLQPDQAMQEKKR